MRRIACSRVVSTRSPASRASRLGTVSSLDPPLRYLGVRLCHPMSTPTAPSRRCPSTPDSPWVPSAADNQPTRTSRNSYRAPTHAWLYGEPASRLKFDSSRPLHEFGCQPPLPDDGIQQFDRRGGALRPNSRTRRHVGGGPSRSEVALAFVVSRRCPGRSPGPSP